MDPSTPEGLFKDTTNIKSIKQDISVFVSIGGWTFSDNGTATQPLLGEIAGDETKRKSFANNMVSFLRDTVRTLLHVTNNIHSISLTLRL